MLNFFKKIFLGSTKTEPSFNEKERHIEYFKNFPSEQLDKLFILYRDYLKHEDVLINYRTTWLVSVQSFLIATFGFSYQKKFEVLAQAIEKSAVAKLEISIYLYDFFMVLLIVIGVFTSVAAMRSVSAAVLAINELKEKWEAIIKYYPPLYHLPNITGGGNTTASAIGAGLALRLPRGFLISWTVILFFTFVEFYHDLILLKILPEPSLPYLRNLWLWTGF